MNSSFISVAALLSPLPFGVYLRSGTLQPLLSSEYSPRRALYLSHPGLLWTNVISDSLIAVAYVLFFFGIRYLVRKLRHIEYMRSRLWVFSAFNIFIASCGATVLLRVITIWYPLAQISIGLKLICAAASLPTAIVFAWRAREIVNGGIRFFDLLASDQRQAEALRRSEALLDRTNRIAHIGGWEIDLLTNEVTWSDETARIHGLPPGYKPTLEEGINFFAPESRYTVRNRIKKGLAGSPAWEDELQVVRLDGSRIWVRVLGEVEFHNGKPIRLFGSMQDRTEDFTQRIALRKSEMMLDRTNRVAGIGGWELDLITGVLTWSNETARMHGLKPGYQPNLEEAISFFAPEDQPKLTSALDIAMRVGGNWDFELTLIRIDDRRIRVRLLGETEFVDGKPVRLFGSVQDKTADFTQREALRKSEALLDRTNRVAGIGGWEFDLQTRELSWSGETAQIHGVPPGYLPNMEDGLNFYAPEVRPFIRETLQSAILKGHGWDLELPLIRADGRRIWVRLLGEVELVEGKPARIFGSIQDKTQEIEQREALRRSQIFLDRTNRVAGIGGWEFDIATKDLVWSDQTARIHGMPAGHKPTYEESFTYFPHEYHPYIQKEVDAAMAAGGVYDLELPLTRPDGQRIWVRLIGEVQLVDGRPARIFGSLQDKTFEVEQREALRKSQNFLDRTNGIAGVGGWEVDIATEAVTWSAETYRIHALPTTYVPSLVTGLSFYAEHDRSVIAAAVEQALETGEGWDLELQLIRADDKPIWVRTAGNVEMKDGRPIRIVGAIQDKTAQVNTRLALERANERITLAMDGGGIGIWDWDIISNRFICDAWMFRMHGLEYTEGPTEMAVWTGRLHADDRPVTVARLLDALEGNSQYRTEFRVIWDDASTHIIQASGEVFRDQDGNPLRMIGIHRDVTESRRLANELQQQHELLSVTLSSIGDAVVSIDASLAILWMNGAAERITGWVAAEAIGKPATEVLTIVYEDSRQPAPVYIDPELSHIRRISMSERVILISRDNTELAVESCATPIYDSRSNLTGSVLVISDLTEQLRHIRETEQLNKLQIDLKLKDEFLSHVSHELRSPLTSVYSFTSIVADGLAGDTTDEQQQYLQIVLKNVVQLQAMIEDLLTVTQSREGRIPIATEDTAVAPVIRDAVNTSHPAAATKQISIATIDAEKAPDVRADPTRLQQIMIILLDNAIKFTPDGGHVSIRFVEDGKMLRFEVEDNGCGIPLDKRARVFEKLYQILGSDHADTSLLGRIGLGLGLHIARDLVRRQGGNIWITGDPEKGTIINFTLRLANQAHESGTSQDTTPRHRKTDWPEQAAKELSSAA